MPSRDPSALNETSAHFDDYDHQIVCNQVKET